MTKSFLWFSEIELHYYPSSNNKPTFIFLIASINLKWINLFAQMLRLRGKLKFGYFLNEFLEAASFKKLFN